MKSEVEPELLIHANEELAHAELVVDKIIQLGETPVINPTAWTKLARCTYDEPSDPYIEVILEQNLNAVLFIAHSRFKNESDYVVLY